MSIIIDYEKIWVRDGYAPDNPLHEVFAYLNAYAQERNLPPGSVELVINHTFLKMERGMKFPTTPTPCPCGCGIPDCKSGTAAVHYMRKKLASIQENMIKEQHKEYLKRLQGFVVEHIEKENKKFLDEHPLEKKKPRLLDFSRSWVLNKIRSKK